MPTLLDSERSLISARDSLLSAMANELNASVQVILALGG
jgi:outer membrane protein TolC